MACHLAVHSVLFKEDHSGNSDPLEVPLVVVAVDLVGVYLVAGLFGVGEAV